MGKRGFSALVGVALLAGAYALMAWGPAPLRLLRNATFDQFQRLSPREPAQHPVAVVDIDDASLAAHGQWPWPRALLADLVDRIGEAQPAVIALDIVFPEPDRMGLENDVALAAALQRHPTVLAQLPAQSEQDMDLPEPRDRNVLAFRQLGDVAATRDPRDFIRALAGVVANQAILDTAARGAAVAAYDPDDDGVVRHAPLLFRGPDGVVRPSLALEALRVAVGQPTILVSWHAGTGLVRFDLGPLGGVTVDALGRVWPHFARWDDARREAVYISAKDVLAGTVAAERLRGRLVLIGTSAPGLGDMTASPVDAVIPGVDIHAQALEGLMLDLAADLRGSQAGPPALLARPSWAEASEALAMVGAGLALLATVLFVPPVLSLPACLAIAGGLIGASWYLFAAEGMLFDLSFAAIVVVLLYAVLMYLATLRRAAQRGTASP